MQIVVLDGYTLNPGDLCWEELKALGATTIYDRSAAEEIVPRAKEAQIVLTNKAVLSREVIGQLPKLKYVGVLATGYNVVDVEAARERGILVANVPTYGSASVAQMVFAHLLNLTQRVAHHALTVAEGRWTKSVDWCYWDYPLVELAGQTMGIVGFGRIGQATARVAVALGMSVVAYDARPIAPSPGVRGANLETLFRESDVVSLHCPLTPQTERLINRDRLALMKPSALLINTSRGGLVDEQALADALNHGQLAGAGLDVLSSEPPCAENPLLTAKNCFITPHIAWATRAARQRLLNIVVGNLRTYLAGQPENVVND
ncbi:MAG: D-2-hydroxyacid dehydrogenase [Thermoguttaceae bacterium]|jgi:glycerate dehydrogenase